MATWRGVARRGMVWRGRVPVCLDLGAAMGTVDENCALCYVQERLASDWVSAYDQASSKRHRSLAAPIFRPLVYLPPK